MEYNLQKFIFDNYKIMIRDINILTGGWMNKKYLCYDNNNNKYVIKLFSPKKVEKMSKGEFSNDYLDNQLVYNLKIENYMYDNNLNCEYINISKNNKILLTYNEYRLALINFLNGNIVFRKDINNIQLYNLGKECAKMHILFKKANKKIYTGDYLKVPSLENLFSRYEEKKKMCTKNTNQQYLDLLIKQKEDLMLLNKTGIINEIPISVTHGDFAADNIIFENNIPKILDFELVRLNSYLLDIGRIIMCYCYENDSIDYYKMINFINGYNDIYTLTDKDIFLAFITVWINEVDMWIKENYFDKEITPKSKRFQVEIIYLTYSLPNLIKHYTSNRSLIDYCFNYNINKRKILK